MNDFAFSSSNPIEVKPTLSSSDESCPSPSVSSPIDIQELSVFEDLVLFGNVDYDNDAMYIEQALYCDQLKL